MTHKFIMFFLLTTLLIFSGCASQSGTAYQTGQQRTAMNIQRGVVTHVQAVTISNDSTMLGPVAGGVAGGFIGSLFGGGRGRVLTTIGGAAAGALAGVATEKAIRDGKGLQISVQLDNGSEIAIVQEADQNFSVGQRVRVISGGRNNTRVQPE